MLLGHCAVRHFEALSAFQLLVNPGLIPHS